MICGACRRPARSFLCRDCLANLRPAPERILSDGVRLVAAFEHEGPARTLIHDLKYRGVTGYANLVAAVVTPRLPPLPLIPVPRAWTRRVRFGVDPALELARAISALSGTPVIRALVSPLHSRRRAGGDHGRPVPLFRTNGLVPGEVVIVDDVVTTGSTILAAVRTLGESRVVLAAAANSVKPGV